MKRFIVFYIVIVCIITLSLTLIYENEKKYAVTDEKLMTYRNYVISISEKYGYKLTEEEIKKEVQKFKEIEESKAEDMNIKQAFKIALIISPISCIVLLIVGFLKSAHRYELYDIPFLNNNRKR